MLFGVALALLLAPTAGAESIVFATEHVSNPARIVTLPLAGGAFRTVVAGDALPIDLSEDGSHRLDTAGPELQYDGRLIARVGWPIDDAQLSPDGRLVAFTSESAAHCGPQSRNCGSWELWVVGVDGTGLRQLTANGRYPRFSPDGLSLAYLEGFDSWTRAGEVTVERLTGGNTSFGTGGEAPVTWSGDSQRIAFSGIDGYGVRVAFASTRGTTLVAKRGNRPVFSPNGTSVAFVWNGQLKVTVIGGATRTVVAGHVGDSFVWPDDSIYYVAQPSKWPQTSQLATVHANGTGRRTLSHFQPSTTIRIWARGDHLMVNAYRSRLGLSSIGSIDLGTGAVSQLTHDIGSDRDPTIRSDGALAYVRGSSRRSERQCLFVKKCLVLVHEAMDIEDPAWSPDRRRLAVVRMSAAKSELWLSKSDGTRGVRLTWDYLRTIKSPSWAPDSKRLVFSMVGPNQFDEHLWMVDVTNRKLSQPWRNVRGNYPAWSPDGRWIVFQRNQRTAEELLELALLDTVTGATKTLVTLGTDGIGRPVWSPDGARIAYIAQDNSLHVIGRDGTGDHKILDGVARGRVAWRR